MSTAPRVRAQPPATDSLAGTGRRLLALLVDQLVALVLAAGAASIGYGVALDAVRAPGATDVTPAVGAMLLLPLVVLALLGIGQWVAEALTGRTLGGLALGIRTVDADTGLTVGLVRVFVRNLVLGLGSLVGGVGQFLVAASGTWDATGRRQGWHDKVARTVVVRTGPAAAGSAVPAETTGSRAAGRRAAGGASGRTAAPRPTGPLERAAWGAPGPAADVHPAVTGSQAVITDSVPGAAPRTGAVRAVPEAAPGPTIEVPDWSVGPAANAPAPGASPDVIAAAPSWGDAAVSSPGEPAPALDVNAPTAPTPRLRYPEPVPWYADATPAAGNPALATPALPDPTRATPALPDPARANPAVATPAVALPAVAAPAVAPPPGTDPAGPARTAAGPPLSPSAPEVRAAAPTVAGAAADAPATPPAGSGGTPAPLRRVRLVFDTGEAFPVVGRGLVGRHPSAASRDVRHVVQVSDPARSVSKTHLEFGVEDGRLWVVDRGSTNGSVLLRPDGTRRRLVPGVRTVVAVGAVVEFGDRRFEVLDA